MAKTKSKVKLEVELDTKLVCDLKWLANQKDEKGKKHSISDIVETALLLTFTTLNAYNKRKKKMN